MTKKSFLPLLACLTFVVLMGAGCRGSDRHEESVPDFPFGGEPAAVAPADEAGSGGAMSACANEYYPLRTGYTIEYRTQGGRSGRSNASKLTVTMATSRDVTVQSSFTREDGLPIQSALQYKCENGSLVASGFVDAASLTDADGAALQGATIETLTSEGEFLPRQISTGQTWGAKYTIKMTPSDRPDVLQERAAPVKVDVSIVRTAVGTETVTVPAGRFEAMKIASNTSYNGMLVHTGYEWWVKGKGMVKSVQGAGSGAITTEATRIQARP